MWSGDAALLPRGPPGTAGAADADVVVAGVVLVLLARDRPGEVLRSQNLFMENNRMLSDHIVILGRVSLLIVPITGF